MEEFKITVIVPIYNTEKYIRQCAKSLFSQTMLEGVEFLFINDGSSDNSENELIQVVDEFPNIREQIRIISNIKNKGITFTRKLGVNEAKGEYIAWVDSDDWVNEDFVECMYGATEGGNIDIVIQNMTRHIFSNGNEIINVQVFESMPTPKKALEYFWTEKHVPRGLPFQISRKQLVQDAISQVHAVNFAEDTFTLLHLFATAKSARWIGKSFYHYRKLDNGQSLTTRPFQSTAEWVMQKRNIDAICKKLQLQGSLFKTTISYIKWSWKREFRCIFSSTKDYWYEYHECYDDICTMYGIHGAFSRTVTWICCNFYPLYRFRLTLSKGRAFYQSI